MICAYPIYDAVLAPLCVSPSVTAAATSFAAKKMLCIPVMAGPALRHWLDNLDSSITSKCCQDRNVKVLLSVMQCLLVQHHPSHSHFCCQDNGWHGGMVFQGAGIVPLGGMP